MAEVRIRELLDHENLGLELRAGAGGLDRSITNPRIQKPGLALTGYEEQLDRGRLLTLGGTEIEYLSGASAEQRSVATETVMGSQPACIVITRALEPPDELAEACEKEAVPLIVSRLVSADFILRVKRLLQTRLSPSTSVHGVLVEVHGMGILLLGASGIGKSEAAIDLVVRGHRLIADDVVFVRREGPNLIRGYGSELLEHHMEIRGLGVIDVRALFGVRAVGEAAQVQLVIELIAADKAENVDRLGLDQDIYSVLGEELPFRRLPVTPGRNIATVIEVAARDLLLRRMGHSSAEILEKRLERELRPPQAPGRADP